MSVHGEENLLVPAHLNFGKFVLDGLRKANPHDLCLCWCDTGDKLTYGSFMQHAVSLSASLTELGVARGDTVAVAGEPRVTYMPTALAVVLTGAAYTPIELHCGRAVLEHKFNLSRPKYLICSRLFWETYSDILRGLEYIKTIISFDKIAGIELSVAKMATRDVDATTFEPVAVRGETDVALIVYSSGTTGMSKGVQLTHLNCIARTNKEWLMDYTTLFSPAELSISYFFFKIYYFLSAGKRVVYSEKKLDLKTVQDYQVNTAPTVPSGVEYILNQRAEDYDTSSLKVIWSSGCYLDPAVAKAFKEKYPHVKLLQQYGTTEAEVITVQKPSDTENIACVGVAAPGVTVKVVDLETRVTLGPNQRGEICARSPALMKGYLGADSEPLDGQGFYLTGDLGYHDEDKQFYWVDRLKDIICYDGDKICPAEVEAVLLRHRAIREAAVVGKPAGVMGELVTAFVVLHPGASVTEKQLIEFVDKEVSPYMGLRGGVRFVAELPRNPRRKILRRKLRDILELESHNIIET